MPERTAKQISASSPVTALSGVGKVRAAALSRIGVETLGDLINHFPRAYQNRGNVRTLSACDPEISCAVLLTVATVPRSATLKGRMTLTKFRAADESGSAVITFFNSRFTEKTFRVGETWRFWGKVRKTGRSYEISSPAYERADDPAALPALISVYSLTAGISGAVLSSLVSDALLMLGEGMPDPVPAELRERLPLPAAGAAYRMIHFPSDMGEVTAARKYFSASETVAFTSALASARMRRKKGVPPRMRGADLSPLTSRLGFTLTAAQKKALYTKYRAAQRDMREAVAVKTNIDHLIGATGGRDHKEQER